MERENFTVVTPIAKHNVVLKSYINGREKRALTNVFLDGDLQFSSDAKDIKGLKGSLIAKAEDLAIQLVVISIDGDTNGILDRLLDFHSTDYAFVVAEINKVTNDIKGEDVKKN